MIDIPQLVRSQRAFFETGKTLDVSFRIESLKKLHQAIVKNEGRINEAMKKDLGKGAFESYMCEVGLTLSDITYLIKHTKRLSKRRVVRTPMAQYASKSFVLPSPYGNTLVISPWNYPFLLSMEPLAESIAAGNTVILKPSSVSPNVSHVMAEIVASCFPKEYVTIVEGSVDVSTVLLAQKFDFIFYTGSKRVGQIVLESTVKNLTPCVLELGGKSPCIVEKSADIPLTAKRIVFGKYLNCGQTCVAPDYILCDKSVVDRLIECLKGEIVRQFGKDPLQNKDYGRIVSRKHYDRLMGLVEKDKVCIGGYGNPDTLQIAPTVLKDVTLEDRVMGEEIFGPILPILTYDRYDRVFDVIKERPTPLALYLFSKDRAVIRKTLRTVSFGGGCVNDVVIHLANSEMGFGGVGTSGMGSYHGKVGFDTFSHKKSIVDKKTWIDLPMRYQPYRSKLYDKLIRLFLK